MSKALSIPELLRRQAGWCEQLGSPLYADLLAHCAEDYEHHGPIFELLEPHAADDESSVLALRLMGAVHRLVLEKRAPELAAFYPSVGGRASPDAWPAFVRTVESHRDEARNLIERPLQTNEVGRSGSLLGGFGLLASRTAMPLRLLEVGASAGLNLRWDRYRYDWGTGAWGDPDSTVRFKDVFTTDAPSIPPSIEVVARAGCDLSPIDASSTEGRLTLLSYVWADQTDRIRQLDAAIGMAAAVPCVVERASGADWLRTQLAAPATGVTTVIFHSVVWQYISPQEQEKIVGIIEDAGRRASEQSPLAWLRMEPNEKRFEVRLRIYPGFEDRAIATTRPHSPSVRWLLGRE
ncbi:MAG TPA: DUF2332 domain-containing protein [Candidatus Acidoferrum sp.]|jgi:hypothetical protein|nr:DUF2332 domain-containing protein [Candidatus Acidoferrum sp.]